MLDNEIFIHNANRHFYVADEALLPFRQKNNMIKSTFL